MISVTIENVSKLKFNTNNCESTFSLNEHSFDASAMSIYAYIYINISIYEYMQWLGLS